MSRVYHRTSINGKPVHPDELHPGTVHRAYMAAAHLFMFLHPECQVTQRDPWKVITTLDEDGRSVRVKYYDAISERFCIEENLITTINFDYSSYDKRWRQINFNQTEDFEKYYCATTRASDEEIHLAMQLSSLREMRDR